MFCVNWFTMASLPARQINLFPFKWAQIKMRSSWSCSNNFNWQQSLSFSLHHWLMAIFDLLTKTWLAPRTLVIVYWNNGYPKGGSTMHLHAPHIGGQKTTQGVEMIAQWYWSHILSLKYLHWLKIAKLKPWPCWPNQTTNPHWVCPDRKSVELSIARLPNSLAVFHLIFD